MKKWNIKSELILLVAVLVLTVSVSACAGQQELLSEQGLIIGEYGAFPAMLTLEENGDYIIWGTILTSFPHIREGEFTVENGRLLLSPGEFEHIFVIDSDYLIFESGTWLEGFVKPGTIFHLLDE